MKTCNRCKIEGKFGHGAIPLNKVHHKLHRLMRKKVGKALPFNWEKGYDVRDTIGQITIKNQGSNYSCGGQAGGYFLEIDRKLRGVYDGDISAKSIYAPIHYPGGGTTVTALFSQLGGEGANKESVVPSYYINGQPLSEAMMIEKSWQTTQMIKDALTRAGYTPYDIGESIEETASTIENYGAVIWMIRGKSNGTWLSMFPRPPQKSDAEEYFYHYMCCIGAKLVNGQKTIIALQSLGEEAGDNGVQYFTEDWFKTKNIIDCFTFIYDSKIEPSSDNKSIWAEILRWFKSQWSRNY